MKQWTGPYFKLTHWPVVVDIAGYDRSVILIPTCDGQRASESEAFDEYWRREHLSDLTSLFGDRLPEGWTE